MYPPLVLLLLQMWKKCFLVSSPLSDTDVLRLNMCSRLNDLLEENQWPDCCGGTFSGSQSSDLRGSGANLCYLCLKSLDYMN